MIEFQHASSEVSPVIWRDRCFLPGHREIAEESPVALTYNGSTYAVMMATPADLEDFAVGFSLSEDIIDNPSDIDGLDLIALDGGVEARMWLKPFVSRRHLERRRNILGPTGCGLCGVESVAAAMKPVPRSKAQVTIGSEELILAMSNLQVLQELHRRTRSVHATALWHRQRPLLVREDVGRHNALDKLIGAAARANIPAGDSVVLLTSRVSVELVQKTAQLGAPIIAAVSAPTSLAVRVATAAGITLIAILREDGFEIFSCPERVQ
jgi:FdhD protein